MMAYLFGYLDGYAGEQFPGLVTLVVTQQGNGTSSTVLTGASPSLASSQSVTVETRQGNAI